MATIVEMINPLTGLPEQVDKLDHTAQEIDDAADLTPQLSNPNILDNWYFGNPVDQRGGYVVPSGTQIYADSALTDTSPGVTDAWRNVEYVNSTYCIYRGTAGTQTYYIKTSDAVRGYTGSIYGIDRWKCLRGTVMVATDSLELIPTASDAVYLQQFIENPGKYIGQTVTFSVLLDAPASSLSIRWATSGLATSAVAESATAGERKLLTGSFKVTDTFADVGIYIPATDPANKARVYAAKLELGSQQTLAHQENGVWVLNEISNYGEQLARCQRYFQTFATESLRPTNALDFRPVMRTNPALSTITVGGKTLYTASADL